MSGRGSAGRFSAVLSGLLHFSNALQEGQQVSHVAWLPIQEKVFKSFDGATGW